MPILGFCKERLNPDFSFVDRFLVCICEVEGSHSLKGLFCYRATDPASCPTRSAARFERTGIADASLGSILLELICASRRKDMQFGSVGADIQIPLGIVVKITLSEEFCSLVQIRKRNKGKNMLLFKRSDDLCSPIGGISSKLTWPQLPAEANSPEQIKNRLVFHDLRGRDKGSEDDSRLSSVYHIVRLIA